MPTRRICAGSCTPTSSGCSWGGWTSFIVKYLVELVLRFVTLLTMRCAIHGADSVVRLTLTRRIPLVAGPSTVVVALPVVVVGAAGKVTAFLLLFVCPELHHVT